MLTVVGTVLPFLWPLVFLTPFLMVGWFALTFLYAYRAYQGQRFEIPMISRFTNRYSSTT